MGAYETTQTSWGSEVECLLNVQGPGFCPGHCQTHKPTEAKKKKKCTLSQFWKPEVPNSSLEASDHVRTGAPPIPGFQWPPMTLGL